MFCMFGVHLDKVNKFDVMKRTHPKLYDYCMDKLGCKEVLEWIKKTGSQHGKTLAEVFNKEER